MSRPAVCSPYVSRVTECHSQNRAASEDLTGEPGIFASPRQTSPGSFLLLADVTVSLRERLKLA